MVASTVCVRHEDVSLTSFGPEGGRPLLFFHGYARHPLDYHLPLEELGRRGWRVEAPFLFANHRLRRPPTSFWACAALGLRARRALIDAGRLDEGAPLLGHSTGGAVALAVAAREGGELQAVAVNPVQPSRRGVPSFIFASGRMNAKLALGLAGEGRIGRRVLREFGLRFYANWLRAPGRGLALIGGLSRFRYEDLARWRGPTDLGEVRATVLYGPGDEFYPASSGLAAGLDAVFQSSNVRVVEGENSHEWLLIKPRRLADEFEACLAPRAARGSTS